MTEISLIAYFYSCGWFPVTNFFAESFIPNCHFAEIMFMSNNVCI